MIGSTAAWAITCGIGLGLGLWTLASMAPRMSRPRLARRIAPYLADASPAAREESKRHLIETAGKKEIGMMVPLVFLILPITIAFAIFPGLLVLQVGF